MRREDMFVLDHLYVSLKRAASKAGLLITFISLLVFTVASAASGDLDTTFSGDGRVTSNIVPSNPGRFDEVLSVVIQPNGKIVAAGFSSDDFALARFNANGSLDTTFHLDGRLITNFGGDDKALDVAVQSNGKIIVAGWMCDTESFICDVALARYNPNGTLDTTFSTDGKVLTDYGGGHNTSL